MRAILVVAVIISASFKVSGQDIGAPLYDGCVKNNLNDSVDEIKAITIRQSCLKKFGNLANIGWELDESGIGACHMIWAGAEFSQTSLRQAPTVYSTHVLSTPKKFNIEFYVPKVFGWEQLEEPEMLDEIANLFGGGMPKYACGFSTQ